MSYETITHDGASRFFRISSKQRSNHRQTVQHGAAIPVGTAEFLPVGNDADKFIFRKGIPNKSLILRSCYFIGHKPDILRPIS